ncbi:MAG: DUF1573 domain-containing protein [Planctomycetes bacterium]|nr:DUF1573 domain-containing protein [Planctomycetota bacterium]MCH8192385.1 DUF1573 domain-containing protein [Planctomycetota bacterium]
MKTSRVISLTVQTAALLSISLWAAPSEEFGPQRPPTIHFEAPVHDFGEVSKGTIVRHDFLVENTGFSPLKIKEVKPNCGCTLADDWPKLLQPGESGIISIQVKTDNFRGPITKSVRVESNDPNKGVTLLHIKGNVWMPIEYPFSVPLKAQLSRDSIVSKAVKIINKSEDPLTLSGIRSTDPRFKADVKTLKHGREFELTITTVPPLQYGHNRANIILKTSNPEMSQLSIMTYVTVTPPVDVIPTYLRLNPGKLKKPLNKYVTVRNRTGGELKLSEAKVSIDGVGITLITLDRGNSRPYYRYQLTFPAGYEAPEGLSAQFTFKTSDKEFPQFVIPIRAGIRRAPSLRSRPSTPSPGRARRPFPERNN